MSANQWWVAVCPSAPNHPKGWTTIIHRADGVPRFGQHWHNRDKTDPCIASGTPVPKEAERMVI